MDDARVFLYVSEIAEILGRSKQRVYQMMHTGQIPSVVVGGRRVIPTAAWETWIESLNVQAKDNCKR
jgi:excisionase family DNA binding protein